MTWFRNSILATVHLTRNEVKRRNAGLVVLLLTAALDYALGQEMLLLQSCPIVQPRFYDVGDSRVGVRSSVIHEFEHLLEGDLLLPASGLIIDSFRPAPNELITGRPRFGAPRGASDLLTLSRELGRPLEDFPPCFVSPWPPLDPEDPSDSCRSCIIVGDDDARPVAEIRIDFVSGGALIEWSQSDDEESLLVDLFDSFPHFEAVLDATVLIIVGFERLVGGQVHQGWNVCTGTAFESGYVLTAYHCLLWRPPSGLIGRAVHTDVLALSRSGHVWSLSVPEDWKCRRRRQLDYAALAPQSEQPVEGLPAMLAADPTPGLPLWSVSYRSVPREDGGVTVNKYVQVINCEVTENDRFRGPMQFPHSCDTHPGSSGALLFAQEFSAVAGLHVEGRADLGENVAVGIVHVAADLGNGYLGLIVTAE